SKMGERPEGSRATRWKGAGHVPTAQPPPRRRPPSWGTDEEHRPDMLHHCPSHGQYLERYSLSAGRACFRSTPSFSEPLVAISATISTRGPTARNAMPASPASLLDVSGTKARAKPSFAASLRRAAVCATGRTVPDSEISPK